MTLTVGEKIRNLRKEKNLTQDELATLMNLSKSAIAMYETNKNYPNLKIIKQLCHILDTTGDYLIGLVDDPKETYTSKPISENASNKTDEHMKMFKELTEEGQDKVIDYTELVYKSENK